MAPLLLTIGGTVGAVRATVIRNGELLTPEPAGRVALLVIGDSIACVGDFDADLLERAGLEVEIVDVDGAWVIPGFIDPHIHLLGGSGEGGFAKQTPEIRPGEVVTAGITTVVGTLGVDTTMKTPAGLLAKVKAFNEEGISAFMWTGGYDVPPTPITASVRTDILFINEVIGVGELAIADERASDPALPELARIAHEAYVGGLLSKKAGITHFHVGEGKRRLRCLHELLDADRLQVDPAWLYPTHVQRSEALVDEAIALVRRGSTVDFDVAGEDLERWLPRYLDRGGDPARLTLSSDASKTAPGLLHQQLAHVVHKGIVELETVLPMVTANTARVLGLPDKGSLAAGADADIAVLDRESLEVLHVIARGKLLVRDGEVVLHERAMDESNRRMELHGIEG